MQNGLKQKSTIKMMFMGDDDEKKVLDTQNKICAAMTQEELQSGKFTAEVKK